MGRSIKAQYQSFIALLIVVGVVSGVAGAVWAHSGATGVVATRMDAMKDMGKQMKSLAQMIRGQGEFDRQAAQRAAAAVAAHADDIPKLFPAGSLNHPSEATPAVWTDWERFTDLADELSRRAEALGRVAETAVRPAALRAPFAAMGKSCKSCHADFRIKKGDRK